MKRVFLIVLDSFGIGAMPDSESFGDKGVNIENLLNKSKGDYAYTLLDVEKADEDTVNALKAIDGVIRVRVIE